MTLPRRHFLFLTGATLLGTDTVLGFGQATPTRTSMYGLIGKMTATPGQRDTLAAILLRGIDAMPGCLSYIVAEDPAEPDALWITEVWDNAASHQASLALPSVQSAIAAARPLIAGFSHRSETRPVGGTGLAAHRNR